MQRPCRERARRAQAREHAFRGGQPRAARARIGIPDSEDSAHPRIPRIPACTCAILQVCMAARTL